MTTALSPQHRAASVARMASEQFDILVVGGGVTGAGAALDAATRGLNVALVEATDYAAGASSKSSKLIHGGLRYLEMLDFALVREALTERGLLLTKLAPHLVKPVPFLWPLTHRGWERPYVGTGLLLYDTMGGRRAVPRARHLSKTGALRLAPALRPDALVGGVQFYDAQEDDARMVAVLARTAAAHGAALATSMRMDELVTASGRVTGIRATDLLTGTELKIGARHVVLATGAWTGREGWPRWRSACQAVQGRAHCGAARPDRDGHRAADQDREERPVRDPVGRALADRRHRHRVAVRPVAPGGKPRRHRLPARHGEPHAARAADARRHRGCLRRPSAARRSQAGADTTKLSREHAVRSPAPGLSVIAGGKYTTYRVMARDLIDVAVRDLSAGPGQAIPGSRTHEVPLAGADGYQDMWETRERIADSAGLPVAQVERLLGRYGSDLTDLLALMASRPALREPVPLAGPYLGAEIVYACSHEGAVHLDDVLSRRTRIRIEVSDRGAAAAPHAAGLMAGELGWDPARTAAEISSYQDMIAADLAAEAMPDDPSAFEAATDRLRDRRSHQESSPITSIDGGLA